MFLGVTMNFKCLKGTFFAVLLTVTSTNAEETKGVVTTIKPLHSLVSGVIGDTGKNDLLIMGNSSPHGFHLKPSQMKLLSEAKIVFFIGDNFEVFLKNAFNAIPSRVIKSPVAEKARLRILPFREGGLWEEDQHDGHDHSAHEGVNSGDMHVWLNPLNAVKMIKAITRELSNIYPKNRNIYKANARDYIEKIMLLDTDISESLTNFRDRPFIVFHDGYQYFEKKYNLNGIGSIMFDPTEFSSPKRLKEIQNKLKETSAACIFYEPQFSDRLVKTVIEGTSTKTALIDPLGASLKDGQDLYFKLLQNMSDSFKKCFSS